MPRLAKVTDALSAEAQAVMVDGFANSRPAATIARDVLEKTGEKVTPRTVSRRMAEWREKRSDFTRAREQFEAMKAAGFDGTQMLEALAFERLQQPGALDGTNPIGVSFKSKEIRLKEEQLELRRRQIEVSEKKLKLLVDREQRVIEAATGDKGEAMTPEERIRQIKEIYGLAS